MSETLPSVQVNIDRSVKHICPSLAIACVHGRVVVQASDSVLIEKLNQRAHQIAAEVPADKVGAHPLIAGTREAYRSMGKDPSRYRGSCEALLRRITSGKGLYFINNVVDVNNLVSLESFVPVGTYDLSRISGQVTFRLGASGESYKGIGKDVLNLERLPVFCDDYGPFGSPTSDSERAMITPSTRDIVMMIIDFSGKADLESSSVSAVSLLRQHASGTALSHHLV